MIQTPVLFLAFNRLDTTKRVFEMIKKARPPKLYFACDGPRENHNGEAKIVKTVRNYVTENINWDCKLLTLFRDKNLGCKYAVSGAIDWFFENEDMGIILEDDCLPNQSFFHFCEELLVRYRYDNRVSSISGSNPFQDPYPISESYFFSGYNRIWGWATWRSAWEMYDVEITNWPAIKEEKYHYSFFNSKNEALHFERIWDKCFDNLIDTWDYQWLLAKKLMHSCTAVSSLNLVKNIGFSNDATHTNNNSQIANAKKSELRFPLTHPKYIVINYKKDKFSKKFRFNLFKANVKTHLSRLKNIAPRILFKYLKF